VESAFISKILAYSARKNSAKGPPAYSTLKPDTSSDSPSVRSNGARLVSASVDTYHIMVRGQQGIISQVASCEMLKACSVKVPVKITRLNTINPRLTSYEIVWAIARIAPIKAYFELDAHPDPRMQ